MLQPKRLLLALVLCAATMLSSTGAVADDAASLSVTQEQPVVTKCERKLTPISYVDLAKVLRAAHQRVFERPATDNGLAMAWAQVAFENAGGRISYNHNLGNVCAGPASNGVPYFKLGRYHFKSFESFDDAADAYWRVIKKCGSALRSFNAGNPHEAAARLKRCHYYEADEALYSKNLSMLFYQAKRSILKQLNEETPKQEKLPGPANEPGSWEHNNGSDD